MNRSRSVLAALTLVLATATACTSAATGHGQIAASSIAPSRTTATTGTATSGPSPAASSVPSSAVPSTTASSAPGTSGTTGSPLRCSGSTRMIVGCFGASLAAYWRGHVPSGAETMQDVLLDLPPTAGDDCAQHARVADGPFTCTYDGRLFLVPAFQKLLASTFNDTDRPYAYASVLSHEYGHFLQIQVHDPMVGTGNLTQAQSRAVEQQADCLSGVWAHDAATVHGFDAGHFDEVAQTLIRTVSSNPEIYSHGTPDERFAALDRGLGTGRPSSCGLAGLH